MTGERDKPLALDMPFEEAFERFLGTDPDELPDSVKLRQGKGPPKRPPEGVDNDPPRPEGAN